MVELKKKKRKLENKVWKVWHDQTDKEASARNLLEDKKKKKRKKNSIKV